MKELLLRGAQYNAWANNLFIGSLLSLTAEALDHEVPSSFPSLRKTVVHLWAAEDMWLQRIERVENPVWKGGAFEGTIAELCFAWRACSAKLVSFTEAQDEETLRHLVSGVNMKGQPFADPLHAVLQHVVNHGSYHRGQLVTMLRQVGVTSIPNSDLIVWARLEGD